MLLECSNPVSFFANEKKRTMTMNSMISFTRYLTRHVFKFNAHMITFFKTSMDILMKLAQKDYYFMITQDS